MASAFTSHIVEKLNLKPYPEMRDPCVTLFKSHLPSHDNTCISFLLPSGSVSHIHRIPFAETWHFYMGEPMTVLEMNDREGCIKLTCLGPNPIDSDQPLQYTVSPNMWLGAYPTQAINILSENGAVKTAPRGGENHFSLVVCTCALAFQFDDFELARHSALISRIPKYESRIRLLTFA